jgi:hypothetical protein
VEHEQNIHAREKWNDMQLGFVGRLAESLSDILKDTILPVNKHTRRKADFAGSTLSMKGLLKFFITNGRYRKIFQSLSAGEKRVYKACILIDNSASMKDQSSLFTCICAYALILAFQALDLERHLSVITFGSTVGLVKPPNVPLTDSVLAKLLSLQDSFHEDSSLDADGLAAASALLNSHAPGVESVVLVLTDGFGTRGLYRTQAILDLNASGARVLGIQVGGSVRDPGLMSGFQDWVACTDPQLLPKAIEDWYVDNVSAQFAAAPARSQQMNALQDMLSSTKTELSSEIARMFDTDKMSFFANLTRQFDEQRVLFVDDTGGRESGAGVMTIDVCFALDCTGSMASWIGRCKEHIEAIILCLKTNLSDGGRNITIRLAFCAYRQASGFASHVV